MYYVYILYSTIKTKYYIGQTSNIESRLDRHNAGKVKSTKHGIPWEIIYYEKYCSRSSAMLREKEIKSYKSGNAFKNLVNK